jgi:hypothetical protein
LYRGEYASAATQIADFHSFLTAFQSGLTAFDLLTPWLAAHFLL